MALLLVALSGCDIVLGIGRDPKSVPSAPDAPDAKPLDAFVCAPDGSHDEDSDGFPDTCDTCPTVVSTQGDDDGDGVGNECDPSSAIEKVIAFYPMTTPTSGLVLTHPLDQNADSVTLKGSTMTTQTMFSEPERIVLAIDHFERVTVGATLALDLGNSANRASCDLSRCSTTGICLQAFYNGAHTMVTSSIAPADIKVLTLVRVSPDVIRCELNEIGSQPTAPVANASNPPATGPISVFSTNDPIDITSLIVYDTSS